MTLLTPDLLPQPRLQSLSRLVSGPRWRHEAMRAHSHTVLYWFTRGQGRFTVAGAVQGYGPHHALILPAGAVHGFDATPQTQGWVLSFPATMAGLPTASHHLRLFDLARQTELTQFIDRLSQELAAPEAPEAGRAVQCWLGLIAVWLVRQIARDATTRPEPTAAQKMAARFAEAMERGFREGLDVADIARDIGVTPDYLSRVCRESCGRSAHELLAERRLYEARRMLDETDQPVGEIARAAGFGSAAYFTRAFQAETGQTPSDFRRAHRAA